MQVLTIRGDLKNILSHTGFRGSGIRPTAQTLLRVISSSSGYLKEKLTDFDCRSRKDLKRAITSIFNEIDKETLVAVFVSGIERLTWMIRKKERDDHQETRDKKHWVKIGRETGRSRTFGRALSARVQVEN
jgi:hypothetical protein